MNGMDRWIDRHWRRLQFGLFLQNAAEWLAGFLFVFGAAILLAKLAVPQLWPHVLWLALAAVPVTLAAWWLSRRRRYTRGESIAMLDRRLNAGGLLMTLAEAPDDQWAERLPHAERLWRDSLPKLRPVRFSKYLAMPLLFAVGAGLVPLREAKTEPILRNSVGRQAAAELEQMLDLLEESVVLDEDEQKQLQEEIEKLAEEAEQTPLTHEKWETVDALREKLRVRVESASLVASKGLDAAVALSEAPDGELSSERTAQLEKDVLEALRKLTKDGRFSNSTSAALSSELQRLMKEGRFSGEADERQAQLDSLKEFLDQEWDKLSELRKQCQGCEKCEACGKPGGT